MSADDSDGSGRRGSSSLGLSTRAWLVLLLLAVGAYRVALTEVGRFHFGDERKYKLAVFALDEFARGDPRAAVARICDPFGGGRPGFILYGLVPAGLQRAAARWTSVSPFRLEYYQIPAWLNVVVTLGTAWMFFVLAGRWTGSEGTALAATLVYSLLFNTSAYVRHLVPYDQSLMCFLASLLVLTPKRVDGVRADARAADGGPERAGVRPVSGAADSGQGQAELRSNAARARQWTRGAAGGVLAGLGFACYPGYYAFPVITGAVCLAARKGRFARTIAFALASAGVLLALEGLHAIGGTSYFGQLHGLSGTITMGDFSESYRYAWRYLSDVEGAAGMVLLPLFGVGVGAVCRPRTVDLAPQQRAALCAAIIGFLWHATAGALLHFMVFYGRLLHMYLPFLVMGAVTALHALRPRRLRVAAFVALAMISAGSFVPIARRYATLSYPADIFERVAERWAVTILNPAAWLWVRSGGFVRHPNVPDRPVAAMVMEERPEGQRGYVHTASHQAARTAGADLILVNFHWLFLPDAPESVFVPPAGYELIVEAPHPNAFPGNAYEVYGPAQRQRIRERGYTMRIYRRTEPPALPGAGG
ncbi:MAG: hypothetical protein C4547_07710 [Phycisphaerales bacterium]|nr:MAG: hypothetical protein C4547_07710 [Phycisphaerales bacterium]